jgi:hypothetical protein
VTDGVSRKIKQGGTNMKKRIISLLFAVMKIMGMLPMTVLAEEACTHGSLDAVYTDNGDKTHTVTYVCEDCGE